MTISSITLHWQAASDADSATDYQIWLDDVAAGEYRLAATVDATEQPGASGVYVPAATALAAALARSSDPTTVSLPAGTEDSFPANTAIVVDKEIILLGALSTGTPNTYANCSRGLGATLPEAHADGATVYGAHESTTLAGIDFGSRHLLRARCVQVEGSNTADPALSTIVLPTPPPDANHATIWGIVPDQQGNAQAGLAVSLTLSAATPIYIGSTGEVLFPEEETTETDADGYFEFFVPRAIALNADLNAALTISRTGAANSISFEITTVPNKREVHFRECLAA